MREQVSLRSFILLALLVASTGCAARVPAPAAAEPLWTLWRRPDGDVAVRHATGLDRASCDKAREGLEFRDNMYVEIDRDMVELRERPVGKRTHYMCRPDGEGLE